MRSREKCLAYKTEGLIQHYSETIKVDRQGTAIDNQHHILSS
jgi:hypothetical protein